MVCVNEGDVVVISELSVSTGWRPLTISSSAFLHSWIPFSPLDCSAYEANAMWKTRVCWWECVDFFFQIPWISSARLSGISDGGLVTQMLFQRQRWSGPFSPLGAGRRLFCRTLSTEKWTRRTKHICEDAMSGVSSLKWRNCQLRIVEYRCSASWVESWDSVKRWCRTDTARGSSSASSVSGQTADPPWRRSAL